MPEQLKGAVFGLRTDIVSGLTGVKPERLVNFEDPRSIGRSLRHFAESTIRSGELSQLVSHHLDSSLAHPPNNFRLISWLRNMTNRYWPPQAAFFALDTEHGLILHARNSDGLPVAWCLGMSVITDRTREFQRFKKLDPEQFGKVEVMIEQIQGPTRFPKEATRLASKNFHWEHVLVTLAFRWARQIGLPRLLLQPAENNIYIVNSDRSVPEVKELFERMYKHYDKVALECGFRRKGTNSVYSLETTGLPVRDISAILAGKA